MTTYFLYGSIPAIMLVDWYATARNRYGLRVFSKPLTLMLLITWFALAADRWQGALLYTGLALVFSLLGDIFLLKKLEEVDARFFFAGVGAFLAAQVCFILAFNWPALRLSLPMLALTVGVAAWDVFFGRRLLGGLSLGRALPLVVYMLAISLMLISGLSTLFRPDWAGNGAGLVAAGAVLFYVSDSTLAYKRFVAPLPLGELGVMVTYHLAQVAIIAGMLLRYSA